MVSSGTSLTKGEGVNGARAALFGLLGRLLLAPPNAALLARLCALRPDESAIGDALATLTAASTKTDPMTAEREYHALFIGLGRGEVLPYASYYRTGFLHDRPLAALRADLARLGIERTPGIAEPEDHLGFLCETMAGLLSGDFPGGDAEAEALFEHHLRPWAERCFTDIAQAEAARFYRAVGRLGQILMDIETAALGLPA